MKASGRPKWLIHALAVIAAASAGLVALDEPKNDFRFAIVGDRTGGAQPQIYGRVWREIDLFHPEFVINVGDTIQGPGHKNRLTPEEQWTALRPLWARYAHYTLYFTPGNHDVWSPETGELFERETRRKLFYSFDYQDAHITVLDSTQEKTKRLSEAQLDFLEKDLKANKKKKPKFVFFHHPYWIQEIDAGRDFRLHSIARKYGVDCVITGHGHRFVRRVEDGIVYLEVGSSGGQMTRNLERGLGFQDGIFYHWVWAHVKGRKVSLTVKEIGGQFGEGRMFSAEKWDENGPSFNISDPALTDQPET
jgi:predicted phosphodiesterase